MYIYLLFFRKNKNIIKTKVIEYDDFSFKINQI